MSAGSLLAPNAFCMNYSVWFLHIETWHPDTHTHLPASLPSPSPHPHSHSLCIPLQVIPILGLDIETKPDFLQRIASFASAEMPCSPSPSQRKHPLQSLPVPSPQSPQGSNLVTPWPWVFSSFRHIQHRVYIS
uniref:Uncharacterized protein n=1 Tax=Myotis myotis TaxID=51298 RepID=A0A7J7UPZ7_MYOMY|nr:hypothetical protein mMyoMyo1_008639 [Myotis myotis]